MDHADYTGLDVAVREQQPPHEVLERGAKVLEMVSVEERVPDRVHVREDDAEVHEEVVHLALGTKRHHAVDRVQREPADDEEEDDAREILRGLDLPFARRAEYPQHRPRRLVARTTTTKTTTEAATGGSTATTGFHRDDLL